MKKIIYLLLIISILTSCVQTPFEPNYKVTAEFNEENITTEQKNKIIEILQKRFLAYKLRNEITFNGSTTNLMEKLILAKKKTKCLHINFSIYC